MYCLIIRPKLLSAIPLDGRQSHAILYHTLFIGLFGLLFVWLVVPYAPCYSYVKVDSSLLNCFI
jgi:hypothetical protein